MFHLRLAPDKICGCLTYNVRSNMSQSEKLWQVKILLLNLQVINFIYNRSSHNATTSEIQKSGFN